MKGWVDLGTLTTPRSVVVVVVVVVVVTNFYITLHNTFSADLKLSILFFGSWRESSNKLQITIRSATVKTEMSYVHRLDRFQFVKTWQHGYLLQCFTYLHPVNYWSLVLVSVNCRQWLANQAGQPFDAHCCHMSTAIRLPERQPWASVCPDVKNYKRRLNPVWHRMPHSCTHMTAVGVKGLKK